MIFVQELVRTHPLFVVVVVVDVVQGGLPETPPRSPPESPQEPPKAAVEGKGGVRRPLFVVVVFFVVVVQGGAARSAPKTEVPEFVDFWDRFGVNFGAFSGLFVASGSINKF